MEVITIITKWNFAPTARAFIGCLNFFTPMSDQDRISPYNINTKSRRQEMKTKKSIN